MTRADPSNRICFEIRVLGVETSETFHVEEEVPDGWPLPVVGDFAKPRSIEGPERRVMSVAMAASIAWVQLEPIDCSFGQKDFTAEAEWLMAHGWVR